MSVQYDLAAKAIDELASWYEQHKASRNEATTRSQLIDRLLFGCLAWPRDAVTMEDSHEGTYTDYTLRAPRPCVLLEAKKEGKCFEIPAGAAHGKYRIPNLLKGNDGLRSTMQQVANYCQNRGVQIALVSNGHQLLAYVAVRTDGVPPLQGDAVVFGSLQSMAGQFLQLWNYLSPQSLQEETLIHALLGDYQENLPPKLSAATRGYPGIKKRTMAQTDLQIVGELILEDVTRSRELEPRFLSYCYSKSGALSQYALISRQILEARYSALQHPDVRAPAAAPAVERDGITPDLFVEGLGRRPILILGDVGVGKTAFIRHLLLVESDELVADGLLLYVDLGSRAALGQDIGDLLISEIQKQLLHDYEVDIASSSFVRGVYNLDLARFREGIYAPLASADPPEYQTREIAFLEDLVCDKREHLRRSIGHIVRGRSRHVIVVIDNADQRDDQIQQQAFLAAQEIADNWLATVFVALRIETFHKSQRSGTLSAYHSKAFTISPPRIDRVLDKRLEFALKLTSGEISVSRLGQDIGINLERLDIIIRVFLSSLRDNTELVEFLENIAGGNVRLALDFVRGFFGSAHVNTEKIIRIYEESGSYLVPIHEFFRAVALGDSEHYDARSSAIANLFDVSTPDEKEHFLLPLLLSYLQSHATTGDRGFVEMQTIYERLQAFGYTPHQVDSSVRRGVRHKLAEDEFGTDLTTVEGAQSLRLTTIGAYHVTRLAGTFMYLDAIVIDTPIMERDVRQRIENTDDLHARIQRCSLFLGYLDNCWGHLDVPEAPLQWEAISKEAQEDIARIAARVPRR